MLSPIPKEHRKFDEINKSQHYNSHPSGVECIDIVEHENFNVGNAIKYLWRRNDKESPIKDLKKAAYYINREIKRLEKENERSEYIERVDLKSIPEEQKAEGVCSR